MTRLRPLFVAPVAALVFVVSLASAGAQDRLSAMPGYDQFSKMSPQIAGSWTSGAVAGTWAADGRSFTYTTAGKSYQFDLATLRATETGDAPAADAGRGGGRGAAGRGQGQPPPAVTGRGGGLQQQQTQMAESAVAGCPNGAAARGRQVDCVVSPDGKLKAFYRDRNLWVANADGSSEKQVTTDGSEKTRDQERHRQLGLRRGTRSDDGHLVVARQHEGRLLPLRREPGEGLLPADESDGRAGRARRRGVSEGRRAESDRRRASSTTSPRRTSTKIDVRDGKPFNNDVVGHYVYNVRWSPDGTELLMNRTNRRQQIMEFVACTPATGEVPRRRARGVADGLGGQPPADALARATTSASSGSRSATAGRNYYLYDLTGKLLNPITTPHDVRVRRTSSRSTRRPACCSTWRATATTT